MPPDASIPRRSFLSLAASALALVRLRTAVPTAKAAPPHEPSAPRPMKVGYNKARPYDLSEPVFVLSDVTWRVRPAG